jgi:SRSO17 transposase
MQARRKNMERMVEVVPGVRYQSLHHFLSDSDWDARAVLDQVAQEADRLLGGGSDCCLLLDETSFPKKGKKSVGVARQWCGRLGKLDNCQVAVFAALACGTESTLIDTRLYLPKEWTQDASRCRSAGIPKGEAVPRSKPQLALEIVDRARQNGVRFQWVCADSAYGQDPTFLRGLEDRGEIFVVDVQKDQLIYPQDPDPFVPERKTRWEQKKGGLRSRCDRTRVDAWAETQPAEAWQPVRVRSSTQGDLRLEALHGRVWLWDGREQTARCWHLLVTREIEAPQTMKYALSNAAPETSLARLVQMYRQRFWVERSFQDAKSQSGLGHYQVRGWRAWHHHIALVLMAMLFMLKERRAQKPQYPLLSCSDIETLLAHFLPQQDVTPEEVIRQMQARHSARQASIEAAYRRQGLRGEDRERGPRLTK